MLAYKSLLAHKLLLAPMFVKIDNLKAKKEEDSAYTPAK